MAFPNVTTSGSSSSSSSQGSTLVQEGWDESRQYSDEMVDKANIFLLEMTQAAQNLGDLPDVSDVLAPIDAVINTPDIPTAPATPEGLDANFPEAPAAPSLGTVNGLTLPNAPEFTADKPIINLDVPLPDDLNAVIPNSPALNDVTIPDKPDLIIPVVPGLLSINLPSEPLIELPDFIDVLEDAPLAPDVNFTFAEADYTSSLTDGLNAYLLSIVNGAATGLDPDVEAAIWERAKGREESASLRQAGQLTRSFASRGFDVPQGAMFTALQVALQDSEDKLSTINRDIMIKQAELEQTNRQFAIQQAIGWESSLLNYSSQQAQRALDAAKFAASIVIDIFQARVGLFNSQVQAFNTRATIFRVRLESALATLEVYKTQLEGQKLIGELNTNILQQYKLQLDGVLSVVEIFKAEISAAETTAKVNQSIVASFGEQVRAYSAQVQAKSAEYDQYATRIEAEAKKIDIFKAEAEAYSAEISGYSSLVTAKVAEKDAEIKIEQELPLELFKSRIQAYAATINAESERLGAVAEVYGSQVNAYKVEADTEISILEAETDIYKTHGELRVSEAGIRIEAAKANIGKLLSSVELLINSKESGARIFAQIAASALSSMNFSASDSGASVSESVSSSTSRDYTQGARYTVNGSLIFYWASL